MTILQLQFGAEGNSPSDPATPIDNAGSWLDFTDLVFLRRTSSRRSLQVGRCGGHYFSVEDFGMAPRPTVDDRCLVVA